MVNEPRHLETTSTATTTSAKKNVVIQRGTGLATGGNTNSTKKVVVIPQATGD